MITIVEQTRKKLKSPYRMVCRELGVPRSSLLRWKRRLKDGDALVNHPGPAKVGPLDIDALHDEIVQLAHGRKRTRGTGALYDRHSSEISRRDLQALVEAARREVHEEEQALERRIDWLVPGMVWSMDDTKKHWLEDRFGHMHLVMDLASRCNLRALGADMQADGGKVAWSLGELFKQHGAPLFMKMDGGSNFKHHAVCQVLAEHGVIPLVSPPHYPPYNGGVEREHQEILRHLTLRIGDGKVGARELGLQCELTGHEVNHVRRRILGGRTACFTLEAGRHKLRGFDRRQRKEVFEKIRRLAVDITEKLDEHTNAIAETAFRYASETWMQSNNMIRVTRNGEVLPIFYRFRSH
jgi:hypothetical protein